MPPAGKAAPGVLTPEERRELAARLVVGLAKGPTPAEAAEIRERHPGMRLHQSIITLPKGGGAPVLIWREPTHGDYELFMQGTGRSDAWQAYRTLLVTVCVWPTPAEIVATVGQWPTAVAKFVDEQVSPFFGLGATIETTEF